MGKKIKKLAISLLLLACFFTISDQLYSEENKCGNNSGKVYFMLQIGGGFKYPDINSEKLAGIKLKFGEAIEYINKIKNNGSIWYQCKIRGQYFYLPESFIDEKKFSEYKLDEMGDIIIGTARIDRLYSIPLNYMPTDLVPVNPEIKAKGYEWRDLKLRKEAKRMFERMIFDAESAGVHIFIISSFRDSKYQSMLYTRAVRSRGLNENSVAKPGHSEHQLGTACDLTSDEINFELSASFEKTTAYKWLADNSWRYGVFLTYPRLKQRVTGYIYEPWHFRYWGAERWKRIFSKYRIILR